MVAQPVKFSPYLERESIYVLNNNFLLSRLFDRLRHACMHVCINLELVLIVIKPKMIIAEIDSLRRIFLINITR